MLAFKYYNKDEVSNIIGIAKVTLDNRRREGKIGYYNVGRRVMFSMAQINEYMEANKVEKKGVNKMTLEERLEQVLDSAEMAYSEATSARENIPDYSANESSKDSINNAESYLDDAIGDLQDIIKKLENL